MSKEPNVETHAAEAAALGFYFQSFFALLTLLRQDTDNAAVGVEQLDDVQLKADGQRLLFQLKHSLNATPPPITLKSRALWRTIKVWVDALPALTLSETTFHLVTVAPIAPGSALTALTAVNEERDTLAKAMTLEAQRVVKERAIAAESNQSIPHADRVDGCAAFLGLSHIERLNLLRRTLLLQRNSSIGAIEGQIAGCLKLVSPGHRAAIARRLIEWWDRQVVYSLCGKRERIVSRTELQDQITTIIGDIEQATLLPDFETVSHPEDYQPDGMLARQIRLVEGKPSDFSKAIREEWRAREQRAKWLNEKPSMAVIIDEYDRILGEHWLDRHSQALEDCIDLTRKQRAESGLKLLRWTHDEAPETVRPIAAGWSAPYYIRGSYQVLAINLKVGWHPDYMTLLGGDK